MEKFKLVDRLHNNYGISYEDAKKALESSGWNILDAVLFLESQGTIKKPDIDIFYTGDDSEDYYVSSKAVSVNVNGADRNKKETENRNKFQGVFESVCRVIDTGNNIFLVIKRKGKFLFKLPITAVILLLVFTFWITIPLMIAVLFLDVSYSLYSKQTEVEKVNDFLDAAAKQAGKIKKSIKKGVKHD